MLFYVTQMSEWKRLQASPSTREVWEVTLSLETMRAVLITARCLLCLYYCCRNAGIGKGMLYVFAPTPTPPWQVLGGVVQMFLVDGHSAAQNM